MKSGALWKLSINTSAEAEDAVSQLLGRAFGQSATSYIERKTGQTIVAVYFHRKPDWDRAKQVELAAGLARIEACGLKIAPANVSLTKFGPQDWAESWKRHFKPLEIGS